VKRAFTFLIAAEDRLRDGEDKKLRRSLSRFAPCWIEDASAFARMVTHMFRSGMLSVLIAFAPATALALNPNRNIDQYFHDTWTSPRGLPGEAVYQILQTPDGYLWMRTSAGLVRFDGVRFVLMDEAIGNESVKAIAMGSEGDLLVRTNSKTLIYRNGSFSDYLPPGALPDGGIVTILESKDHEVLLGSDDFIYLVQNSGIRMLRQGTGAVQSLTQDDDGTVWISGVDALYSYDHGALSAPMNAWTDTHKRLYLSSLAVDHHFHNLWLGTSDGLYFKESKSSVLKRVTPDVVHDDVLAILEDHQGNLWLGTNNSGLIRKTANGEISSFKVLDGLTDNTVLSLYEDREGGLWVGTASGLDHFRNTKLTTLTMKEGLPSNVARTIFESRSGELFAFCSGGRPALIKNGQAAEVSERGGLPFRKGAVFESSDGSVWTNTEKGLGQLKNGKSKIYRPGRLLNRYISAINEDEESLIVATTEMVVLRFKDGHVQPFTIRGRTTPLSTPGNYTFTIYRDWEGALWFGTVKGLFKFAPGEDPMKARQPGIDFPVTSISDDHRGSLWLGGRTPGLTRFRLVDGRVTHYRKKDGLFDDLLTRVLDDDEGNLWISTSSGIYMAIRGDLDDFAEGRVSTVRTVHYGTNDGMKSSEASLQTDQPAGWRASDGKLWFTTTKGLVVVDPNHIPRNDMIPPVIIESTVVNDHPMPTGVDLQFTPGTGKIEFHYTALSFSVPERVRFKYQLEGFDRGWVDAGWRRVAYYNSIPPGKYRFRVIASNDDGLWNMQGASVEFILKPHYYQTGWFLSLCGLVIVIVVVAAFRFNTRRLRVRAEELTRVVDERTKALQLEVVERLRAEEAAVEARENMRHQATHDDLTSLLNRGAILKLLARELSRSGREKSFTVVLMADLDHFKKVNDMYGHLVGDEVLREVARRLLASVRPYDLVGRYGGEEFLVVLNNCDDSSAMERAEALRRAIASAPVTTASGSISVTMSMGVIASEHRKPTSPDEVVRDADAALYAAKDAGRNCCRMVTAAFCNLVEKP
jgi:diguanylate cyclase (GGDEF)-like protein